MKRKGEIEGLRALGWTWSRIGASYNVSEREVRRWSDGDGVPERAPAPPVQLRYGTAFIVNDLQYPYFDKALYEVACQIARDSDVTKLMWDGDDLDFEEFSSFGHNAYKLTTAESNVDGFHKDCRDPMLDAVEDTLEEEDWNNGNHEYRYTRYMERNAPALGKYIDAKTFLKLPRDVNFVEYGRAIGTWLTPKLLVSHGWQAAKWSGQTAKANATDMGDLSIITGHTHRIGVYAQTLPGGRVQWSYEVGHMCDDKAVPQGTAGEGGMPNWQQVAGTIVRYERGGNAFHVELIPVIGDKLDRCIANGREYTIDRRKGF